jgi:DNA mismatch repair protein MutL
MPARLALLGSVRSEGARSQALLQAYALAYPEVAFTLISDGQIALQTPGTNSEDAVASLYGADLASALLPFEATVTPDATITISGFVSGRGFHQPGRDLVVVLVNNRLLSSRVLLAALESGYRSLLPKGRHPLLVARVRVPPEQVDVNVHPAKTEVLMRGEEQIVVALRSSIHQTLGAAPVSAASSALYGIAPRAVVQLPLPSPRKRRGLRTSSSAGSTAASIAALEKTALDGPVPELEPLAQFDQALILTRSPDGDLFLVDQHRAHERILYERLLHQRESLVGEDETFAMAAERSAGQLLLEPVLIELTPPQAASLSRRITELANLGLVCQPFGGSVFLVRSVPALLGAAELPTDLAGALGTAASAGEDWISRVSVALACQSAIRRGKVLARAEQLALLRDLQQVATPAVCPHGSPLLLRYSRQYLTRVFEW